jgi:tetratricopeptide (TPR) repeat protein
VVAGERAFADAEARERAGDFAGAAAAYEGVADVERSTRGREPARALTRAARLAADKLADPERAERDLWRAVTSYPDAAPADDAVRALVRLNRPGLRRKLLEASAALARSEVGDNLAFAATELIEHTEPTRARAEYEGFAQAFPKSGLRDDALWRAARMARAAGDFRGAIADLERLTAPQREALLVGSFRSGFRDDAQLLQGRIYLEDLHDYEHAARAFERLRDETTTSTLRDDAQFFLARTHAQAGDRKRACANLARLGREFPESRYLKRDAPALFAELGCR